MTTFVETGTYKGDTAAWAAEHFEWVNTIEAYEKRYRATAQQLMDRHSNVIAEFGDSRTWLRPLLARIEEPAILWLDAHWCGEGAHDSNGDECPLREELEACNARGRRDLILIDDVRLFQNPPPYPHDPKQWPTFDKVVGLLGGRSIWTAEDVLIAVPSENGLAKAAVNQWLASIDREVLVG